MTFSFHTTGAVYSGPGASADLAQGVRGLLGQRVLVVTDATIRRFGLADPLITSLRQGGAEVAVFDGVQADPTEQNVLAALAVAQALKATGVVGIGGGSPMDVAKVVALLAGSGQELPQVYGVHVAAPARLPLVLVPTTAGTGSEATPIAILTAGHTKKGVVSHHLLPDAAILDAQLTVGLPPAVTAATGIDAMVHAIESYTSTSPNRNAISRSLSRQALRLLGANIRRVVEHGADLEARSDMLLGSFLAGQAFANAPVAAVHALAYPLGGRFHIAHGVSNAVVLPHVMRFNLAHAEADYAELAGDVFPRLALLPAARRATAFVDEIARLAREIGVPATLQALDIPEDSLEALADDAMLQTRLLVNNPRPLTQPDALAIYRQAYR